MTDLGTNILRGLTKWAMHGEGHSAPETGPVAGSIPGGGPKFTIIVLGRG